MSEGHDKSGMGEGTPQGDTEEQLHGQGGEGRAKEEATPPLEEQGKPGQTQHKAPADDVGGHEGGQDRTD